MGGWGGSYRGNLVGDGGWGINIIQHVSRSDPFLESGPLTPGDKLAYSHLD